jgi:hypothetical protein
MDRIKDYEIVQSRSAEGLTAKLNEKLKLGLEPVNYTFSFGDLLCQEMVKYEDKQEYRVVETKVIVTHQSGEMVEKVRELLKENWEIHEGVIWFGDYLCMLMIKIEKA